MLEGSFKNTIKNNVDGTLLRFTFVGALTTLLDLLLFTAFAVQLGLPAVFSNIISYSTAIGISFLLNRAWTFGGMNDEGTIPAYAVRFALSNLGGLFLSSLLVGIFTLLLTSIVAKLMSVPIVFVWNYGLARFWVFR